MGHVENLYLKPIDNERQKTMENSMTRVVDLDGGINFRDIGGYTNSQGRTVKWRKIMRCGHLAALSDNDLDRLEQIGINRVHDFRAGAVTELCYPRRVYR